MLASLPLGLKTNNAELKRISVECVVKKNLVSDLLNPEKSVCMNVD